MGTAVKHPGTLTLSPGFQDVKNYKWRLNPIWHRILYRLVSSWLISCYSGVAINFSQGVRNSMTPLSNLQPTSFTVSVESGTFDRRTRHHILNGNDRSCGDASWRIYGGGTLLVAARTTYLLDEELSKFVGVDASWDWRRPLSRAKTDETNRQS